MHILEFSWGRRAPLAFTLLFQISIYRNMLHDWVKFREYCGYLGMLTWMCSGQDCIFVFHRLWFSC